MKTSHDGAVPQLPAKANLQQLKRQARELLRAWQAADPASLARAAPYQRAHAPEPPKLSLAQLVIARELGFPSWPALQAAVSTQEQARQLDSAALVQRVLALSLGRGWDSPQPERALALLQQMQGACPRELRPALALLRGELDALESPPTAGQRLPPFDAPALAYVCFSGLHRLGEPWASGLLRSAQTLHSPLSPAALNALRMPDPDLPAEADSSDSAEVPSLPLLYGAIARAQSPALAAALLAAGAEPNDGESLYHACEDPDRARAALQIRQLIAHGARLQGTNALLRLLDFEDLAGLELALSLGADVNEAGPQGGHALHHALRRGRSSACLKLLIAQGADLSARDAEGRTPATLAALLGELEALKLFAAQGAQPELPSTRERFLAACAAADEHSARALLQAQPDLLILLGPQELRLLPDQAQRRARASVALMLSLGWPIAVTGDWDASALNQAAFNGDAGLVQLLLEHGARWQEINGFGGDVMGSLQHAAVHLPQPGGDYLGTLQALLAAGAPWPTEDEREELPPVLQAWLDDSEPLSPAPQG
ncbi:ankyrin repeat domain-containing protein [Roseateles sp.]|uniref:ankyrin repeat domain-containing protein n=1 Tax=Roseateles sp. TaxID=1971397 RepID=UPI003BA6C0B7